jgi:hypothetical protein
MPTGVYRGEFLGFLDTEGARRVDVRVFDRLLFVWPRWGIDFDSSRWWFVHPRALAGHFRLERGRSRWRDTEVLQLHYDVSRLPIRAVLYDEIKPLPDDTILGIGGTNHDRGRGDHFFFRLVRATIPVEATAPIRAVAEY